MRMIKWRKNWFLKIGKSKNDQTESDLYGIYKDKLLRPVEWNGDTLKVIRVIENEKYGEIWDAYLNHKKVYIIDGSVVKDQVIIDELDNLYGIPVSERGIY